MTPIELDIPAVEMRAACAQIGSQLANVEWKHGVSAAIAVAFKNVRGNIEFMQERLGDATACVLLEELLKAALRREMEVAARETQQ